VFSLPGLILLVLVDTLKPQEFIPLLAGVPLLYPLTALTLVGFVVDLRLGLVRPAPAPQLVLASLLVAWCLLTMVPRGSQVLGSHLLSLLIPFSLFLFIAHGVQSLRALEALLAVVLALGLFLAAIGVHQAFAPWGCHEVRYVEGSSEWVPDGRACSEEDRNACFRGEANPGSDYVCEHLGLLGTQSVLGRVRFRGNIKDPNELALAVALIVPLAFGFFERRRSGWRGALLATTLLLTGACVVYTRSRTGQVVFLMVLGVYLMRRVGWRGLALGAAIAGPILLLGGRETQEAGASSLERVECWYAALQMLRQSPILGVGYGQFTEHHYLTAHNSYLLTAAELGLPGMALWTATLWLSIKIPLTVLRRAGAGTLDASPAARTWALALLASLAAMAGGMAFLSYAYKELLWVYLGLSAALFQGVRRHAPDFKVRFGLGDLAGVIAVDLAICAGLWLFTRAKLG
jgi:hypothetical protein